MKERGLEWDAWVPPNTPGHFRVGVGRRVVVLGRDRWGREKGYGYIGGCVRVEFGRLRWEGDGGVKGDGEVLEEEEQKEEEEEEYEEEKQEEKEGRSKSRRKSRSSGRGGRK